MIHITCPHCKEEMDVPESLAGRTERCPSCAGSCPVPGVSSSSYDSPVEVPGRNKNLTLPLKSVIAALITCLILMGIAFYVGFGLGTQKGANIGGDEIRKPVASSSPQRSPDAPGLTRAPSPRIVADLPLTVRKVGLQGDNLRWSLTNTDTANIEIRKVLYNGEREATIADVGLNEDGSRKLPVQLSIGDSVVLFQYRGFQGYHKEVIFLDIYTDRGSVRYRPSEGYSPIPAK